MQLVFDVLASVLIFNIAVGHCKEYYVSSNDSVGCIDEQQQSCNTLLYYINNSQVYFVNDSVFYFMEGTHILDKLLAVKGVHNLTMTGLDYRMEEGFHETVRQSTVIITCQHSSSGIVFYNSSMVGLIGITITDCHGRLPADVASHIKPFQSLLQFTQFHLTGHSFALAIVHSEGITVHNISVQNSSNYGLFCINALNINISHSSFAGNNLAGYTNCTINSCVGGNAYLAYMAFEECRNPFVVYSSVISYSNFSFGYDTGFYLSESAAGLSFTLSQSDNYGVNVTLDALMLYGNTGITSGNFRYLLAVVVPYHSLTVTHCTSIYGNEIYPMPFANELDFVPGSVFSLFIGFNFQTLNGKTCFEGEAITSNFPLKVYNCSFLHNKAPNGAGLVLDGATHNINSQYIIQSCLMRNNSGFNGANLFIRLSNAKVILKDMNITEGRHTNLHSGIGIVPSSIAIDKILSVAASNIIVANNSMSGLVLLNSKVTFSGYNLFFNNSASNGGGIFMSGESFILFDENSSAQLLFKNNAATNKGGAIFIDTVPTLVQNRCFIQPSNYSSALPSENITIIFKGNNANIAGSAIYGGYTETCKIAALKHDTFNSVAGSDILNSTLLYLNQSGLSVVSSDPENVYFCNGTRVNFLLQTLNISLLPGQLRNINIATVGQGKGISPGFVIIKERKLQVTKSTENHCTIIQYTPKVNTTAKLPSIQEVKISVYKHDPNAKTIYFHIQNCPLGFELSPHSGSCECDRRIKYHANISCNPVDESFYHEGDVWMSYVQDNECFIVSSGCSKHHCKTTPVNFTLASTDSQCTLNRSGLLCGECAEGLSLLLGSNRCDECNNHWLALIVLFAVAGIALIAFITALDLTVSTGSINGLLFYANVVKINDSTFNLHLSYLNIFISWLNLDLGIEVCFFKGLTSYWKTWLQFAFPVYLWCLMILIIFLSRYSIKVSKLMGRHSISVLATVLLLSFTKIIRTCILVLEPASVHCGSHNSTVWHFDATVPYCKKEHLAMALVTVCVFIPLAFFYTLFLLLSPFIERSRYRCFKWWVKLKPLFDAYNGPYEDKYRMWTGFLLLIRIMYAIVVVLIISNTTTVIIITTTMGFLLGMMALLKGPYRKMHNNFLECFHFVNLIFLAAINNSNTKTSFVFSCVFVSLILLTFVIVVFSHFTQTRVFKKLMSHIVKMPPKKLRQYHKNYPRPLSVDDSHIVTHDRDKMTTVELHNEDGDLVTMKRESLIREGLVDEV